MKALMFALAMLVYVLALALSLPSQALHGSQHPQYLPAIFQVIVDEDPVHNPGTVTACVSLIDPPNQRGWAECYHADQGYPTVMSGGPPVSEPMLIGTADGGSLNPADWEGYYLSQGLEDEVCAAIGSGCGTVKIETVDWDTTDLYPTWNDRRSTARPSILRIDVMLKAEVTP